ncbi:MAG: hypothetical protein DHS80DRAFT_28926 [Piptocephalis tieghemiana]|nr:MAG: hypothetical protein DHS80DRAFT_28926 [Piptocephalis tieghemiana]
MSLPSPTSTESDPHHHWLEHLKDHLTDGTSSDQVRETTTSSSLPNPSSASSAGHAMSADEPTIPAYLIAIIVVSAFFILLISLLLLCYLLKRRRRAKDTHVQRLIASGQMAHVSNASFNSTA